MRSVESGPGVVNLAVPAWLVAEQILWLRRGTSTTQFQLQRLIYIAHGWSFPLRGRPLILDPIYAWDYGPVIFDIWSRYQAFRADPITLPRVDRSDSLDPEEKALIDIVVRTYDCSFEELFRITHHEATPWSLALRWGRGMKQPIPNELIEAHYRLLASD